MKRILSTILIMSLLLGSSIIVSANSDMGLEAFKKSKTYAAGMFIDIRSTDWFEGNVSSMYELGLMEGVSASRFSPGRHITTAEAVTVVSRMHKIYYYGNDDFPVTTPWYKAYVDYADSQFALSAYSITSDMASPITRGNFALLISIAMPDKIFPVINKVEKNSILDLWSYISYDHIYMLYRAGILSGKDSSGRFYPNDSIKRSEVSAIVTRIVDISLRLDFTLSVPLYPTTSKWLSPGTYKVGTDIPRGMYYVKAAGKASSYEIARLNSEGRHSHVSSGGSATYDFITVHNTEYFTINSGTATLAGNIPPIAPKNGKYTDGEFRVGTDIPAGSYTLYLNREGALAEYILFSGSRAGSQGGLFDTSSIISFYIWSKGTQEITLSTGSVLYLSDCYILSS